MKSKWKRLLASVLTASMLLSMVQIAGFAAGRTGETTLPKVEIADQNVNGVTENGADGTSINGKKTIKAVAGSDDEFDITLEVTTVSKSTTITTTKAADVVLVLDVTESMDSNNRWSDMKSAVNSFVGQLLPAGNTTNRISIVIYAGDYYQLCDWTMQAGTATATYSNATTAVSLRDSKIPHQGTRQAYMATNCSAGFLGADVQLDDARADVLQYVVYMTDGDAHSYYNDALEQVLTCTKEESFFGHHHNRNCYETVVKAVQQSGVMTWEGDSSDEYSSDAAVAQTTQLKTNHPNANLIAIGFGTSSNNKVVSKTSNTSLDKSYTTSGTQAFDDIMKAISEEITSAVDAAGTVVTDPMSDYVTFDKIMVGEGSSFDEASKTLSWDLSKADKTETKDGDFTTTTYTLTYRVKVERNEKLYNAVKADGSVPTNGKTTMPYTLGDTKGTLEFIVPTVKSEIPTVNYTIEYYKQNRDSTGYTQDTNATKTGTGEYGTQVTLSDKDGGYVNKYARENYTCVTVDTTITLGLGENVIRVYYDLQPAKVTVNHYVSDKTTLDDEVSYSVPVLKRTDTHNTGIYLGDTFSNQDYLNGDARLVASVTADGNTYTTDNDQNVKVETLNDTVINLYYVKDLEPVHTPVEYTIHYFYREDSWQLVEKPNGEKVYERKEGTYTEDEQAKITGSNNHGYEVIAPDKSNRSNKTYTMDMDATKATNMILDKAKTNELNIYYYYTPGKPEDTTPAAKAATLTVEHYYKTIETKVEDGKVVTYVNGVPVQDAENADYQLDASVTDSIECFIGETKLVSEKNNGFTSDAGNADKLLHKVETESEDVVRLYYTKVIEPQPYTTVTVNHSYWTNTVKTETVTVSVPKLDDNGQPVLGDNGEPVMVDEETTREITETTEDTALWEKIEEYAYVGDLYEADLIEKTDYSCVTESKDLIITVEKSGNVINIRYERTVHVGPGEDPEKPEDATIIVTHTYFTNLETVVGGEVKTIKVLDGTTTVAYDGVPGDSYTASPVTSFKGNNDYSLTKGEETTKTLQAGSNGTIAFEYERNDSNLEELKTTYTVNYKYYVRTMELKVDETTGLITAVYGDRVEVVAEAVSETKDGYVGQNVELDDKTNGYTRYDSNPALSQTLAGNDVFTFEYLKYEPLPQISVTVQHRYADWTLVNGELVKGEYGAPEAGNSSNQVYQGTTYLALAALKDGYLFDNVEVTFNPDLGYEPDSFSSAATHNVSVVADGPVTVTFYYHSEPSEQATVQVIHHYKIVDKNTGNNENGFVNGVKEWTRGDVDVNGVPMIYGGFFAGQQYVASPDYDNGAFEEKDITEVTPENALTAAGIKLNAGYNVINVYYVREIDTRNFTSVTVIHEYYANQSALEAGKTEGRDSKVFDKVGDVQLCVGDSFTAEPVYTVESSGHTYAVHGEPVLTITLAENAADNTITIKYVRAETSYTVVHEYYTDGSLTGSTSSVVGGEVGAEITADSIAKVTSYNGNTYTYTSATGAPLTLVQGENGTITLRYDRSTYIPPRPTYTYTLTINYEDESGNVVATQYTSGRQSSGWNYSVTSPEVEGMTPDQAIVSGILTGNTEITVIYTRNPEPTPSETPEVTESPESEENLNENDTPLTETPEVTETPEPIETQEPEESEELEENDTPLAEVPQTGDSLWMWMALALLSAAGLIWVSLSERKGKRVTK